MPGLLNWPWPFTPLGSANFSSVFGDLVTDRKRKKEKFQVRLLHHSLMSLLVCEGKFLGESLIVCFWHDRGLSEGKIHLFWFLGFSVYQTHLFLLSKVMPGGPCGKTLTIRGIYSRVHESKCLHDGKLMPRILSHLTMLVIVHTLSQFEIILYKIIKKIERTGQSDRTTEYYTHTQAHTQWINQIEGKIACNKEEISSKERVKKKKKRREISEKKMKREKGGKKRANEINERQKSK